MLLAGQAGNKLGAPVRFAGGWNIFNTVVGDGDFSGDGIPDIFGRTSAGEFWLYPGNGKGGFLARMHIGGGWQIFQRIIAPGDLDGDGTATWPASNRWNTLGVPRQRQGRLPASEQRGLRLGRHSALSLRPAVSVPPPAAGCSRGARPDRSTSTRETGPADSSARTNLGGGWGSFKDLIGGQDFTGDGQKDLLVTTATGPVALYPGNESGRFATRVAVPGTDWDEFSQVWEAGDVTATASRTSSRSHRRERCGSTPATAPADSGRPADRQRLADLRPGALTPATSTERGGPDLVAREADGLAVALPDRREGHLPDAQEDRQRLDQLQLGSWPPGTSPATDSSDIIAQSADGKLWLYPGNGTGGLPDPQADRLRLGRL